MNLLLRPFAILATLSFIASCSTSSNQQKQSANALNSKSVSSIISPSGLSSQELLNLDVNDKNEWLRSSILKTWDIACNVITAAPLGADKEGVLKFIPGKAATWKVNCTSGEEFFVSMPSEATGAAQFLKCEPDTGGGKRCSARRA